MKEKMLNFCKMLIGVCLTYSPVHASDLYCKHSIVSDCVGECGSSSYMWYVIGRKDIANSIGTHVAPFCLEPMENNLCDNMSAYYTLRNNSQITSQGDLAKGAKGFVSGRYGDVITLSVTLESNGNPVDCIRLGETKFSMGHINWSR
jgi:hypothetical protein